MFKALNPYQLLAQAKMPVDCIELGRTPELSRFHCQKGKAWEWLTWADFRRRRLEVKMPGASDRTSMISMGDFLLDFAVRVSEQISTFKPFPPVPWDPTDPVRRWLLPYLRVSNIDELKDLLDNDIASLRKAIEQD